MQSTAVLSNTVGPSVEANRTTFKFCLHGTVRIYQRSGKIEPTQASLSRASSKDKSWSNKSLNGVAVGRSRDRLEVLSDRQTFFDGGLHRHVRAQRLEFHAQVAALPA